jgi:hypothetical protein
MPAVANNNEGGFWEPQAVADLNDEILQALDSEWDDVFASRPRNYLSNFDRFYLGRAVEILEEEFNGAEVIVLKDPRISVLTTFWDRALREAGYAIHYIVMVRNPLEVAESLRARDGFSREKSLLLWCSYMIAMERDTRDRDRIFISFDQLMGDWRAVTRRIEQSTGVPFPRDTAAAANEIDRHLDGRLRHHKAFAEDLLSRSDLPDEVRTLYGIFLEACDGAEIDRAAVDAIQAELAKMDALVGPLLADFRGRVRSLARDVAELNQAHAAAVGRADSLEQELAAERALRQREAEVAANSAAARQLELDEVSSCIAAIEAERDRYMVEAEERAHEAAELAAAAARSAAARQLELDEVSSRIAAIEAERDRYVVEAEERAHEAAELGDRLSAAQAEHDLAVAAAQETSRQQTLEADSLRERIAALSIELRQQEVAVAEARETMAETILRAAQEARNNADAAARTNESKLAQRYREVATLTNLLRQQEGRGDQAQEQVKWLLTLNQCLTAQPRWWGFMPTSWRRQRALKRLQNVGLFDGEAYLNQHPDVAEAGVDPLDHYLKHGLNEGRSRR